MKPEILLFDQLITDIQLWARTAASSIARDDENASWTPHPEVLLSLRKRIGNSLDEDEMRQIIEDLLVAYTHTIFVSLDGGSSLADQVQFSMTTQDGKVLPKTLHELFFDRVLDRLG